MVLPKVVSENMPSGFFSIRPASCRRLMLRWTSCMVMPRSLASCDILVLFLLSRNIIASLCSLASSKKVFSVLANVVRTSSEVSGMVLHETNQCFKHYICTSSNAYLLFLPLNAHGLSSGWLLHLV